ncbi:MAG: hypothetical protein WB424_16460 [Terracidiphilus sp.]
MTDAMVTIALFIAAQTGGLIYFAGVVAATLRHHDDRLAQLETALRSNEKGVALLAGKEGVQI